MNGQAGQLDATIARLRQAVEQDPINAQLRNELGICLTHAGLLGDAVASYEEALRLKPDFPEAWNNLSYALCQLGRGEAARRRRNGAALATRFRRSP